MNSTLIVVVFMTFNNFEREDLALRLTPALGGLAPRQL
jgi:hypothetical protein